MVETLSAQESARKWRSRTAAAQGDFSAGIQRSRGWQAPTLAANETYKQGVAKAMAEDRFAKGVSKSSDSEWKSRASASAGAWAQGAAAAEGDFASGIAKVLAVIQATPLPNRGPKGTNYGRVQELGEALRKAKDAGQL